MQTKNIAVIGGGSWATAIVKILSNNVENIHWWLRKEETVEFIQQYRHNPNYLSDVEMDLTKVQPSSDLKQVIKNADFVILAVPAAFLQEALKSLKAEDFIGKKVFSAIKGIVPQHNQIAGDFIHTQFNVDFNLLNNGILFII